MTFVSCEPADHSVYKSGIIYIEAATRGSYQYLILIDEQRYWPENLPQFYQDPNIQNRPIFVRYELTGDTYDVYVPAPNDIPVFGYTVQKIRLVSIKDQ
ncbi:hypothetical protein [Anditalea andensis]|uniref:DUF4377 domain-containing protein n=1 Tax=Anditalea andensis TaxID=1048983 RepID=A0A074L464_9BACT|nr:hypothetical protein [Anditalea andensis]KEO75270.1 hypothetical protein EL17_01650 [Anditalea andensis]